jgi:hypothetical protein
MSEKKHRIIISRRETTFKSWATDASTFALFAGLIGLGVFLESAAMQWAGFTVAFITLLTKAAGVEKASTFDLDGARKRLDEIEAEQ